MMQTLHEILWRNQGQALTPELIVGIIQGAAYQPECSVDLTRFEAQQCGSYVFHAEKFAGVIHELIPLHAAHWQETEKYRNSQHLAYDYDSYTRAEREGKLVLFTVRKHGELVGQCAQKLFTSCHSGTLVAEEDSLFLRGDCRGGRTAKRFVDYMSVSLEHLGVKEIRVSVKHVNTANRLLESCGFVPVATQMVKMIGVANETQAQV